MEFWIYSNSAGLSYTDGLGLQQKFSAEGRTGWILFEPLPVITLGLRANIQNSFKVSPPHDLPFFKTDRGGLATYHGPGQILGFPVGPLGGKVSGFFKILNHCLVTFLNTIQTRCEFVADEDCPGIYEKTTHKKVASYGIRIRKMEGKYFVQHGFSIHLTPQSVIGYSSIFPCGITDDDAVCSVIADELSEADRISKMESLGEILKTHFNAQLNGNSEKPQKVMREWLKPTPTLCDPLRPTESQKT